MPQHVAISTSDGNATVGPKVQNLNMYQLVKSVENIPKMRGLDGIINTLKCSMKDVGRSL